MGTKELAFFFFPLHIFLMLLEQSSNSILKKAILFILGKASETKDCELGAWFFNPGPSKTFCVTLDKSFILCA